MLSYRFLPQPVTIVIPHCKVKDYWNGRHPSVSGFVHWSVHSSVCPDHFRPLSPQPLKIFNKSPSHPVSVPSFSSDFLPNASLWSVDWLKMWTHPSHFQTWPVVCLHAPVIFWKISTSDELIGLCSLSPQPLIFLSYWNYERALVSLKNAKHTFMLQHFSTKRQPVICLCSLSPQPFIIFHIQTVNSPN